jgi:hypothetical protein
VLSGRASFPVIEGRIAFKASVFVCSISSNTRILRRIVCVHRSILVRLGD